MENSVWIQAELVDLLTCPSIVGRIDCIRQQKFSFPLRRVNLHIVPDRSNNDCGSRPSSVTIEPASIPVNWRRDGGIGTSPPGLTETVSIDDIDV